MALAEENVLTTDDLLTRLQVAIEEAFRSVGFVMNLAVGGETDCLIQVMMNVASPASNSVHCLLDVPFPSSEDQKALQHLGFSSSSESSDCYMWLPRGADRDLALLLVAILTIRGIRPDDIRDIDVYEIRKSGSSELENSPRVALDLFELLRLARSRAGDNHDLLEEQIADPQNDEKIDLATELYLLWIDNGDGDMPVHPKVRAHYTELARMRPVCPVDVEAMTWLKLELKGMSDDAIREMVRNAAERMAGGPAWDQAHRDNIDDFIRFKNGAA